MRFHVRRRLAASLLAAPLLAVALCAPAPIALAQEAEKALEKADAFTVRIKTTIVYPFGQDKRGTFKGAGFVVDKERGWIATNAHVASRSAASLTVAFRDQAPIRAKRLYVDPFLDLAILQGPREALPKTASEAKLDCSGAPKAGTPVVAYGHPNGLAFTGTQGIISGVTSRYDNEYLQTDATLNPGNSGGPLVNLHGQVIGISSAKIVSEQYEGMGFAIPITGAKSIIDDLLAGGYVQGRVRFGIKGTAITQMQAAMYDVPQGFMISEIDEDSCFNGTDVQAYDIITAIDDTETKSLEELANALLNYKPGDTAEIHLFRPNESGVGGEEFTVTVTLLEDKGETQG